MKSFATEIWTDFISLFYPRYCFACDQGLAKGEETVCSGCMLELPRTHYHLDKENALFRRLEGRIQLRFAIAFFLFRKRGKVQRLLHRLKYNNHPEIGDTLGQVYGEDLRQHYYDQKFDLIIPVPLHPSRKRKRGYNQSEEFGKGLSKSLGKPCVSDALIRTTKTETQTKKTKLKRWQNVSEVFQVAMPEAIQHKNVLVVDDVITTGATIEACAKILLEAGCTSVSIACIAYTDEGK
jgi:ComF family protein